MKRITLTQPNDKPIVVVADNVSEYCANDGNYVHTAQTPVSMANGHQHGVKETMTEIEELLK